MSEETPKTNVIPIEIGAPQTMREVGIYLKSMDKSITDIQANQIRREAEEIKRHSELTKALETLRDGYVTRTEHDKDLAELEERLKPTEESTRDIAIIRKLVYGCASLILTSVVVALIYLVINK